MDGGTVPVTRDGVDPPGEGGDDGFGLPPGAFPWPAVGENGHEAILHSDLDPVSPVWFRLHLRDGDRVMRVPIPDEVPLWGPLHPLDGLRHRVAVHGRRGLRRGVILVEADGAGWRWATPDDEASYLLDDEQPDPGQLYGTREGIDTDRARFRIDLPSGALHVDHHAVPHASSAPGGAEFSLIRWRVAEGTLEGILAVPPRPGRGPGDGDDPRWPLLVELHAGPINGLRVGDPVRFRDWCARGFAVFMPAFRADGSLGREPMRRE